MENTFERLVGKELADALLLQGITKPTAIQQQAIPHIISNRDVIAASETGSGKTLAYLLPIYQKIDFEIKSPQAFVLTPTHELSSQVYKQAEALSKGLAEKGGGLIKPALIIGGANTMRQLEKLKEKPHIIIGSAGRILEIIKMKKLTSHCVKTIVLDEADKLLDENNIETVTAVVKTALRDRQILVFSASIPPRTEKTVEELSGSTDIVRVFAYSGAHIPDTIEHIYFYAERRDKIKVLRKLAHSEGMKKAIVFINDPYAINELTGRFIYHGMKAAALHGKAFQDERKAAINDFKRGTVNFLIASDIAARGLDIPEISHIINFDAPEDILDYQHRAGRTGRMGAKGTVVTIVDNYSNKFLTKYEKAFGIKITEKTMSFGKAVDIEEGNKKIYKETTKNERRQKRQ